MLISLKVRLINDETGNPLTPHWREEALELLQSELEGISFDIDKANGDSFPVSLSVEEIK